MPYFAYRGGRLDLSHHTHIMGILNVTPDSFSDGGRYFTVDAAADHALEMQAQGADILDIGAQSTRPGHTPVPPGEEWRRLEPVLHALRGRLSIPISIDTYYPDVARRAAESGAHIFNDVSGDLHNGMLEEAARCGAGLILMHAGGGADAQDTADAVAAVRQYFAAALTAAARAGLPSEAVCLDPGIGFGKPRTGDLELVARLPETLAGLPETAVLVGASRKRVVAACCGNPPPAERLPGTLALHTLAQWNGAHILRVHDVAAAVQAARVTDALRACRHTEE